MSKDSLIRLGIRAAKKSTHNFKVAALLIKNGRILNIGYNRNKTDPMFSKNPSVNKGVNPLKKIDKLHAEMVVISGFSHKELKGATVIVVRASPKKGLGMAKPCTCCQNVLKAAGIKHIGYTLDYGGFAYETI